VAVGAHADLVVLDPATVGPGPVATAYDLPAGAGRIVGGAVGVHHVVVNGQEVVDHGVFTDARPGTMLRSGRHTDTVTVASAGR
jgi:N-acyl-D-aspartate/D-glutamate deacylase